MISNLIQMVPLQFFCQLAKSMFIKIEILYNFNKNFGKILAVLITQWFKFSFTYIKALNFFENIADSTLKFNI